MNAIKKVALGLLMLVGVGVTSYGQESDSVIYREDFKAYATYDPVEVAKDKYKLVLDECKPVPSSLSMTVGAKMILKINDTSFFFKIVGFSKDREYMFTIGEGGEQAVFYHIERDGHSSVIIETSGAVLRLMVEFQNCEL